MRKTISIAMSLVAIVAVASWAGMSLAAEAGNHNGPWPIGSHVLAATESHEGVMKPEAPAPAEGTMVEEGKTEIEGRTCEFRQLKQSVSEEPISGSSEQETETPPPPKEACPAACAKCCCR